MLTPHVRKRCTDQRGEGTLRLVFALGLLVVVGYLGIQDIPVYFSIQNCKHDLSELARGSGVVKMPAVRVAGQARKIANDYAMNPDDIKVEQMSNGGIKITLDTNVKLNLIVTDYDWHVSEVYQQSPF